MEGGYFRVDGADLETGEESHLVVQAATIADAESVARVQGLLISAVRVASAADWGASSAAGTARSRSADAVITFEARNHSAADLGPDAEPVAGGHIDGNVTEIGVENSGAVAETPAAVAPKAADINRQSVFADVRLSPDVVAWAADRPAQKPAPPKDVSSEPAVATQRAAGEPPAEFSGSTHGSFAEPVASDATSATRNAPAEIELETVLVGGGEQPAFETATTSVSNASIRLGSTGSAKAAAEESKPPAPKVVPVKATPVLVPKMGLAANLRRIAPAARGGLPPRIDPAKAINATSKPIARAQGDPQPSDAPPEKSAPIRTTAATVQSRRSGRLAPIVPIRRTLHPPAGTSPKAESSIADVQTPDAPATPIAEMPAPVEAEVTRPAAGRAEATGLDQLFANLVSEPSVKPADPPAEAPRHEPILADATAEVLEIPAKAEPAIEAAPAELDFADEAPRIVEVPAQVPAEPVSELKIAARAAAAVETKAATFRPAAKAAKIRRRPMPPLILLILGSVATLLTLGGIALILVGVLTPTPTAGVELSKVDFHIQMLMLAIVGGTAMLSGLLLVLLAGVIHVGRMMKLPDAK